MLKSDRKKTFETFNVFPSSSSKYVYIYIYILDDSARQRRASSSRLPPPPSESSKLERLFHSERGVEPPPLTRGGDNPVSWPCFFSLTFHCIPQLLNSSAPQLLSSSPQLLSFSTSQLLSSSAPQLLSSSAGGYNPVSWPCLLAMSPCLLAILFSLHFP